MRDADPDTLAYHAHLALGARRRLRLARVFKLVPAGHRDFVFRDPASQRAQLVGKSVADADRFERSARVVDHVLDDGREYAGTGSLNDDRVSVPAPCDVVADETVVALEGRIRAGR